MFLHEGAAYMRDDASQQQLFASSQTRYGWRSVQQLQRGQCIVVMQKVVKVLGVRHEGDECFVSYTDPDSGKKVEQLYSNHDFVYVQL